MELVGLAIMLLFLYGLGICLAFGCWFVPKLQRFALPIAIVPAPSILLLTLSSWYVLDRAPICGPDPEWDRCVSAPNRIISLAVWLAGTSLMASAAFLIQKSVNSKQDFFRRRQDLSIVDQGPERK